jgi:hypothetical protein
MYQRHSHSQPMAVCSSTCNVSATQPQPLDKYTLSCWFLASQIGNYEGYYLLGYDALWSGISSPMFRRNVLPPYSVLGTQATSKQLLPDYKASHSRSQFSLYTIEILRARVPSVTASLFLTHVIFRKQTLLRGPSLRDREVAGSLGLIIEMERGKNIGNEMRDNIKK